MVEIETSHIIAFITASQISLGYEPSIYEISTQNTTNSDLEIPYKYLKKERGDSWSFLVLFTITGLSHFIGKSFNFNIVAWHGSTFHLSKNSIRLGMCGFESDFLD